MTGLLKRVGYRGDGSVVNKDLKAFLVGQEITDIDYGAMTEEGMSVARIRLRSGDQVLILPQPVESTLTALTGLRTALRFVFEPKKAAVIWTPGGREGQA